ncbi:MAG TPA: vWA domain-containing protein, partial [Anaerolineales bacterium]
KKAASDFVDQLYFPYDHVAVITFDNNVHIQSSLQECGDNPATCEHHVQTVIHNLDVMQIDSGIGPGTPGDCDVSVYASGPCRRYNLDTTPPTYVGFDCPGYPGEVASCTTTNIGGGLQYAANEFGLGFREESLWVVILLTDGAANSSEDLDGFHPFGYCPGGITQPFCRDASASTRHCAIAETRTRCEAEGGVWDPANYDADDFAHDMADFAGKDQNALIFTIGLGNQVINAPQGDPDAGERLLQYTADAGRGLYFFAPTGNDLRDIFKQIASNIAVRLTH